MTMQTAPSTEAFLWKQARERGTNRAVAFFGGTPIAVLAGFGFASAIVVLELTLEDVDRTWAGFSASLFIGGSALLLLSLLALTAGQDYSASPDELLTWVPEATQSARALENLVVQQRFDFDVALKMAQRASFLAIFGVSSILAGLGAAVLSVRWDRFGIASAILVLLTIAFAMWWQLSASSPLRMLPDDLKGHWIDPTVSSEGIVAILGEGAATTTISPPATHTLEDLHRLAREKGVERAFRSTAVLLRQFDGHRTSFGVLHLTGIIAGRHHDLINICLGPSGPNADVFYLCDTAALAICFGMTTEEAETELEAISSAKDWRRSNLKVGLAGSLTSENVVQLAGALARRRARLTGSPGSSGPALPY